MLYLFNYRSHCSPGMKPDTIFVGRGFFLLFFGVEFDTFSTLLRFFFYPLGVRLPGVIYA